jgi:hypothetical protein
MTSNGKPKILIAILTAHHQSRAPYRQRARETYLKGSSLDYRFVYGTPENGKQPEEDELFFPVDDRKEYMALKNQAVFQWALDKGYDFCFRCCDDTWVFPDRVAKAGLEAFDYAGQVPCKLSLGGTFKIWMRYFDYMHGGCGIWLSRKAMERIVKAEWKGPEHDIPKRVDVGLGFMADTSPINWDDKWIGEVLKGEVAWDDPIRNSPLDAYTAQGISVFEDDLLFQNDDPLLPISIHDPGVLKVQGDQFKTLKEQVLKAKWQVTR